MGKYSGMYIDISKEMNLDKLNVLLEKGDIFEHHSAYKRGYVSRKIKGIVENYKGRFGKGYKVYSPNWNSTSYCYVTYYIFADD